MAHDLTIVTLSRNTQYFKRLLSALSLQDGDVPSYLGVVVVNDYTQVDIISAALQARWASIDPRYNTSFSVGNNMAVGAVPPSEWILFLNDDAIPDPDFLSKLWSYRGEADVIGALLLHEDGTVNHAGTKITYSGRSDHIGRHKSRDTYEGQGFVYTPSVTFAAAMVRTEVFNRLGGLDERYVYGWEDTDFCLRVLDSGGIIGCARDAVATHGEGGTRSLAGGEDRHNGELFIQTWGPKLKSVLNGYKGRMRGETMEGV